ncbi:tellurite resistance protein TerC [Saccharopolyspora erythraea NRRL 2338]|uniref:Integral membrane protein TerC n=2 Tax=Saccharopolyspora erythraea TaxID=1836 RepID=A4FFV2_SACEN|nr:TerC family protein [Saccharopolyspora erythraea]EQD81844.1 tellurite resistance protein TerC [Saccharopolyspora erythraea D]PFG96634.1 tellurite resistance protein TerC [Saccharopolyspora erythraea NRRL 2338]QRK93115.1 TerC family protein [Saccharopolyspora erythraea]CAM02927.1 integral membrane protein TerC [Saccharopolyspora erythraea NRRL 2338]
MIAGTPWWAWVGVLAAIVVMLVIDLLAHRRAHVVSIREALGWSSIWLSLGLGFGVVVWLSQGGTAGGEYFAAYLVEKSLAVDNVFVFALLFSYFAVPPQYQHRVLFYGVLGALVMRAGFIAAGAVLLERFHWIIYVFGALLLLTGIKMARHREFEVHPDRNPMVRLTRRLVPMTTEYHGQRFWIRQAGRWLATPLLVVLVAVETTDLVFAVDSIPAVFAVTSDPFLVFTSNAFAILGLRALYFLLAGAMHRFTYLRYGLAAILVFVGAKMLLTDLYKIPIWISLSVIIALIGGAIAASWWRQAPATTPEH